MVFDLLIRNGKIIDGTGAPWYRADLAVKDGVIVQVGLVLGDALQEIDVNGAYVTPGFIDIHTHSDESVLVQPTAVSKISQGVTTEVIGNCGYSAAPALGGAWSAINSNLAELELSLTWESYAEYLDAIDKARPIVNIYPLVGHGTLLLASQGSGIKTEKLLEEALLQGARGLSTGLVYPPGCFASTEELVWLGQLVQRYGGIYASHIRDEGEDLLAALAEAIEIGERSGVPVEVAHLKASGPANHGKTMEALELLTAARERGVDIAFDAYPYTASATGLRSLLPRWVYAGGQQAFWDRLNDPKLEIRLETETAALVTARGGWSAILLSAVSNPNAQELTGLTLGKVAQQKGLDPWRVVKELLLGNPNGVEVICFTMDQADVDRVICHPWVSYGSDATSRSPQGVLAKSKPHPRAYGTFPRILKEFVFERKLMRVEEAVRKMTSGPATRLNLRKRGLIKAGMVADLTCFTLEDIEDRATYMQPHTLAAGIKFVVVNGILAYTPEDGVSSPGYGEVLSEGKGYVGYRVRCD